MNPRALVEDIGVGQQQRVEILRVLHRGADVLILDEPTAVLTAQETAELFKVLRALTAEGVSVIFISHKLREVLEIADRVTVPRRGREIDTVSAEGDTEASLAKLMVGRDVLFRVEKEASQPAGAILEVDGLELDDDRGVPALRGLSLQVHAGEIVGVAGVDGNGQSELVETITGLRVPRVGHVRVGGRDITGTGVRKGGRAGRKFACAAALILLAVALCAVLGPMLIGDLATRQNLRDPGREPFTLDHGWAFVLGSDSLA